MWKLKKAIVDKKDLPKALVVMAKEYDLTILQTTECEGRPGRDGFVWIYFEVLDDTVFRLFKLHLENAGIRWIPPEKYEDLNP